ncbi:hypothetical protein RhiirB3_533023 [Rhizophagus irregularis]|nr:hypothetical protein RhiirB3_533023 [Rhizophagus irregularis]
METDSRLELGNGNRLELRNGDRFWPGTWKWKPILVWNLEMVTEILTRTLISSIKFVIVVCI